MSGETVLVTGAAGFIGGRVVQRLVHDRGATVRALVHRLSGPGAHRLARLPVEIVQGSLTDRGRVEEAVAGCDTIIHCAGGNRQAITQGTRTLIVAGQSAGVVTFIHLSSAAVHGHDTVETIDEDAPLRPDTTYAEWKVRAEQDIARATRHSDLSSVVFRPLIAYGPHSQFVSGPLSDIAAGAVLAEGGIGPVNQVYVDNLIDAIFLAIDMPGAWGETFLLADDEALSWHEYYRRLGASLDEHPPFKTVSRRRIRLSNQLAYLSANVTPPFRLLAEIARSRACRERARAELSRMPWLMNLYASLPADIRGPSDPGVADGPTDPDGVRESAPPDRYAYPSERWADLHASSGRIANRKAKDVLGWSPRVGVDEAMDRIAAWVAHDPPVED